MPRTSEWVWTIDPIDGTRSFIRGLPLFASLIALLHKGESYDGELFHYRRWVKQHGRLKEKVLIAAVSAF